jgi:hypothetical protein
MTASTVTGKGRGASVPYTQLLRELLERPDVNLGNISVQEFFLYDGYEVWDDLRIAPGNATLGGLRDPAFTQFRDNGSSSIGVFAFKFSYETVANNQKELFFETQMPHRWKEGSNIFPHLHFSPMTTDTGTVRWGFEYTWANVNEAFPETTILYSEATIDSADQYGHRIPANFGEIDGAGKRISAVMSGRIFRDSAHANDDLNADMALLSTDIHHRVNSLGSRQVFIK